jgi:hypothetical protein
MNVVFDWTLMFSIHVSNTLGWKTLKNKNVMLKSSFWLFFVRNCKQVVLLKFGDSKLFLNHSLTLAKTIFNLLANSIELGLLIRRLVLSAYNINLAFLAVTVDKSFMCI